MKSCVTCKETKELDQFDWKDESTNRRQSSCKACVRIRTKNWYEKNKERHKKQSISSRKERRDKVVHQMYEFLKSNPCTMCGETNPVKLEFDHLHSKEHLISTLLSQGSRWDDVRIEVDKCQVLCASCHRLKTAKDFNWLMYQLWKKDNPHNPE